MRLQRPLRRAGGAARIDDQCRIICRGIDGREIAARLRQQLFVRVHAGLARATHADHMAQARHLVLHRPQIGDGGRLNERHARGGVRQPIFQRVGPEEVRERQRDGTHLEDGDVGNRGLRALRQDERHAVAALDAERGERVRQPVGRHLDIPERVRSACARFVFPIERETIAVVGPLPAARPRHVVARRHVPAEGAVQLGVAVDHGLIQFT